MSPSAKDNAPTWAHALAGQLAGMVGLSVVHPIDTVKIRVQANGGRAMSTASSLVKRDGPLALYRGLPFSLPFAVPAALVSDPPVAPHALPENLYDGLRCWLGRDGCFRCPVDRLRFDRLRLGRLRCVGRRPSPALRTRPTPSPSPRYVLFEAYVAMTPWQ